MFKMTTSDPQIITLSTSAYRLLLTFYPTLFRRTYGPHMAQVFRDCCLKTYRRSGPPGMLTLWALTLFDWFKTVIEEQINRGTEMTRTKFIRSSGWGMVLAAISLLLTFLPDPIQGLYRIFGAPTTASGYDLYQFLSDGVGRMPFLSAIILITLGLLGLRARYGEQAGNTAKMALGAGVLGGVAGVVSNILWTIGYERSLMNISMAVMFAGLFVFGLVALREKPMPRGNGLPALAGFWWPFIVIRSMYHQVTGHWQNENVPFWLSFALFSGMSFFLAWLGYVLQSDAPPEQPPVNPHKPSRSQANEVRRPGLPTGSRFLHPLIRPYIPL